MSDTSTASTNKASIASHPAFPAVVALWLAVVAGLACLVAPMALFERLVMASGIADVVPAAAPPLGTTARIGLAFSAAAFGAVAGLLLARKLATRSGSIRAVDETDRVEPAQEADRIAIAPLSVRDELGMESLDDSFPDPPAANEVYSSAALGLGADPATADDPAVFELTACMQDDLADDGDAVGGKAASLPDCDGRTGSAPPEARMAAPSPDPLDRDLRELGMVELVERFARALKNSTVPQLSTEVAAMAASLRPPSRTAANDGSSQRPQASSPDRTPNSATDRDEAQDSFPVASGRSSEERSRQQALSGSEFARDNEPVDIQHRARRPFDNPARSHDDERASQEPAWADETDRALREALEKLQRMSGAA